MVKVKFRELLISSCYAALRRKWNPKLLQAWRSHFHIKMEASAAAKTTQHGVFYSELDHPTTGHSSRVLLLAPSLRGAVPPQGAMLGHGLCESAQAKGEKLHSHTASQSSELIQLKIKHAAWRILFFFFFKQSQAIAATIPPHLPSFFSCLPANMRYIPAPLLEVAPLGFQPESVRKLPDNYFYKSSGQPSAREASLNGILLTQQHKSASMQRKGEERAAYWRRQGWQARPAELKFAYAVGNRALVLPVKSRHGICSLLL